MKYLHRHFKTRKLSTESLDFTLITRRSGLRLLTTSTFPAFKASYQKGFTTRLLVLITYLLSSIGMVCGSCSYECTCDAMYQSIECSGISKVPKNIPNDTRFMSITNGHITELNRSDLFSLKYLRMLSLENNTINSVSSDCFNNSKNLRKLNLNGNLLSTFPEALIGLNKLKDLHLQGNDIVCLNKSMILQKLTFLDLENNKLNTVTRQFFKSMSKLKTLKMSFNCIQTIDADWLKPMRKLKILELESSFVIPPSIGNWFSCNSSSSLNSINLAYNNITSLLPRTFTCATNLTVLILNNNNITELPLHMSLRDLEQLDLGCNQITHLRSGTFRSWNKLKTLGLQSNQIKRLPNDVFQDLHNLEQLDLNYNYLSHIELDTFANLTSLTHLLLSGNLLQVIHPQLLYRQLRLSIFDLSHNKLEYLPPDLFHRSTLLNRLSLNNNSLLELPNFDNLEHLEFLDVSWNSLTGLSPNIFDGTILQIIKLSSNKIETIYWMTIQNLFESGKLETFLIDGNPIKCDCNIYWALLMKREPLYMSNFTCSYPIRFESKKFQYIDEYELDEYLICSDEVDTALIQKIVIIWFSVLTFIVFVYWVVVYHKSLKLWRAWSPSKRKRKCEVNNRGKSNTYYRITSDNFWNNNHLFAHRMTSSFRRVRLTESLHSNEYLETIV